MKKMQMTENEVTKFVNVKRREQELFDRDMEREVMERFDISLACFVDGG